MAQNTKNPKADAAPAPKKSGAPALALMTSSFAVVLIAMMFATGAAQRAALPRLREMAATLPFVKKPVAPDAVADSAAAASAVAADEADAADASERAAWTAASDSLALLEQQLAIALAEVEATAVAAPARTTPDGARGASEVAGNGVGLDAPALRDLARLVKVLDAMKPVDAARILDSVDDDLAVEAIRKLKERQAGRVLALMNPTKAITVGQRLGRGAGSDL
jgi:flagellar motility protein MotE (MotC chaperone)